MNASSKIESHWKATKHIFQRCEDVTYDDGEYDCVATATTAGDEETITHRSISINTQFKTNTNLLHMFEDIYKLCFKYFIQERTHICTYPSFTQIQIVHMENKSMHIG